MVKQITLAFLLTLCLFPNIALTQTDYTLIPDPNFESSLSSYDDIPGDGKIPTENIISVTTLRLEDSNISDLTGIEKFRDLESFISRNNNFSEIDFSQNTKLSLVNIRGAVHLKTLSLENNDNLTRLLISNTIIESLDITKNVNLISLTSIRNIALQSLDISENNKIKRLEITQSPEIKTIDTSNNINLERFTCSNNISLTEVDLSTNTKLETIECSANPLLVSIDLSNNTKLGSIKCSNNTGLKTLNIKNGNNSEIHSFDASNCAELNCILIDEEEEVLKEFGLYSSWRKDDGTRFTADCDGDVTEYYIVIPDLNFEKKLRRWDNPLGIDDGLFPKSKISEVVDLNISSSNIEDLTGIEYFIELTELRCNNNSITKIDLSKNTKLIDLDCSNNQLVELNLKNGNNASIRNFDAQNNPDLRCIQVDDESKAIHFSAPYQSYKWKKDNQSRFSENCGEDVTLQYVVIPDSNFEKSLESFDNAAGKGDGLILKSSVTDIKKLRISLRNIEDLTGIEAFTSLEELECPSNELESLDLSQNTSLKIVNCFNNKLKSLILPNNDKLTHLNCSFNDLTALDVSGKPNLTDFNSTGNTMLECIQVDDEIAAENGNGIYKLWSKDFKANYSEGCYALGIETTVSLDQSFIITPNPSNGLFTISGYSDLVTIEVFDSSGKRVAYKKPITSSQEINMDVSELGKGIYIVKAEAKKNISLKKIVIH